MGRIKFRKEKSTISTFFIISFIIFVASIFFLIASKKRDEMGGIILCAMLAFISGYACLVFVKRLIKYNLGKKLLKIVVDENVYSYEVLADKAKLSEKKVVKELSFLINNNYLIGFNLGEHELINLKDEYNDLVQKRAEAELFARRKVEEKFLKEKRAEETNRQEGKRPSKRRIQSNKCPNCGANISETEGKVECPYCGNMLNIE